MRRIVALLVLLVAVGGPPASGQEAADEPGPPLFEQVCRTVRRHFYDPTFGGRDWEALTARYRARATAVAEAPRALRTLINTMLGELHTSHLALIEPEVWSNHFQPEMGGTARPQLGVEFVRWPTGVFVSGVWEGGPAERAGLRRGHQVELIDGRPPLDHPGFLPAGSDPGLPGPPAYYLVPPPLGGHVTLHVHYPGATPGGGPAWTAVEVAPEAMTMVDATRRSVHVIHYRGRRIGYVHFWHFLHPALVGVLRTALAGEFAECDALILDVRGRGGSPMVLFQLLSLVREGRRAGPPWRDRCATLIDEGSRSAKEIWAWHFRREALGPVIGRRTEGAVIAAQFRTMADGSALMVPMSDVRQMSGGESLEGVGVPPHFPVPGDVAGAAGRDEILDAALRILWAQFGLGVAPPEEDVAHPGPPARRAA